MWVEGEGLRKERGCPRGISGEEETSVTPRQCPVSVERPAGDELEEKGAVAKFSVWGLPGG